MIRIELYGVLSERTGCSAVDLPVSGPIGIEQLLNELATQWPVLADDLPRAACAVGDTLMRRNETVSGDAPVVVLPPVSGG